MTLVRRGSLAIAVFLLAVGENAMSAPPYPITDAFELELSTQNGPELGNGITEEHTVLWLDRRRGNARLLQHRTPESRPGEPVGVFEQSVPDDKLAAILREIDRADLAHLPASSQGGPGLAFMRLRVQRAGKTHVVGFSSRDVPVLERLEPLLSPLHQLTAELVAHPTLAVAVTVRAHTGKDHRFDVTLKNVGKQPVCFVDPRTLGADNRHQWAGVQVAHLPPEKPGTTEPPLRWSRLALDHAPADKLRTIKLAPGDTVTVPTARWKPTQAGTHLVQAVVSSYGGPTEIDGCPLLRGAATSDELEVHAP